jgi:hypothetical protein
MGNIREAVQLYRHFDTEGRLLYVGISLSTVSRLSQHKDTSEWFAAISRVTVERFPTRKDALLAEAAAIATEAPSYNKHIPAAADIRRIKNPRIVLVSKRAEKRLNARRAEVAELGSHADGGGLTLEVDRYGRRWVWRYRRGPKRREMGLGPADQVTLAEARAERDRWRKVLRSGHDPIDARRRLNADPNFQGAASATVAAS